MRLLIIFFFVVSFSNSAQAITLIDAVSFAIENNPDVEIVEKDKGAVEQELKQAKAGYLPTVDFNINTGEEYTDSPGTRANNKDYEKEWVTTSSLDLNLMLADGGEVKNEVERQKRRVESSNYRLEEETQQVALDAAVSYLELMKARNKHKLAQTNLESHEKFLAQMEERLSFKHGSSADVLQAKSRLARAKSRLAEAVGIVKISEANYVRTVSKTPEEEMEKFEVTKTMPATASLVMEEALVHHPKILVAKKDVEVSRAEYEKSKAGLKPEFNFKVGVNRNENIDGVDGANNYANALLNMRYNLFNGGKDKAAREEFLHRWNESKAGLRKTEQDVEQNIHRIWNNLEIAKARKKYLEEQVNAAVDVVWAYNEQFKLGRRTLLDLLDAENELYESRTALEDSKSNVTQNKLRIIAATGGLLDELGVSVSKTE